LGQRGAALLWFVGNCVLVSGCPHVLSLKLFFLLFTAAAY
jgi:hypothetical protein